MYTINKNNGVGRITSESDTKYTVKFEDGTVKDLLKSFVTVYSTREETEAAIEEREISEENNRTKMWENTSAENNAGAVLSEINRENARKNLPSSMR